MATVNLIGPYLLRTWFGAVPDYVKHEVEILTTPGVNHEALRLRGLRSGVITRDSVVDVPNLIAGRLLYASYTRLIEAAPSKLVWNGYDFDVENLRAAVVSVTLLELRKNAIICNPLTPGNLWDLRVRWSFLLVPR